MKHLNTFEEHGEVLNYWNTFQINHPILIYFDQHLDFKKIAPTKIQNLRKKALSSNNLISLYKTFPFSDNDSYSYGLDDFLYAAASLNLVSHIIWVYPETNPLSLKQLAKILVSNVSLIPGHGEEVLSSIKVNSSSVSVIIAETKLEITTLSRISEIDIKEQVLFDLDLDFFYNSQQMTLVHQTREIIPIYNKLKDNIITTTASYSINTGHLPYSYKYLSTELSQHLGLSPLNHSRISYDSIYLEILHFLVFEKSYSHTQYFELVKIINRRDWGGAGKSICALLALNYGNIVDAKKNYYEAVRMGDKATMSAYKIGVYYLSIREYKKAINWFEKITIQIIDSIEAHSLCLSALCHLRLGEFENGTELTRRCIQEIPIHNGTYELACLTSQNNSETEEMFIYKEKMKLLNLIAN